MDKRERAAIFNERLAAAMQLQDMSKSELARQTRVDRSTIGQLLDSSMPRLPNGQLLGDLAETLQITSDWLLGLANRPELPAQIIAGSMSISPADRSASDAQLMQWHRQAAGTKIRHVPATLPDLLKTESMLEWEYSHFPSENLKLAKEASKNFFEWLESGVSDYEIALPLHEIISCASGTGYYSDASKELRYEQLRSISQNCRDMYPRLRIFLFDARKVFSSPVTVFGQNLAIIYVGQFYIAFNEQHRIRPLVDHFDWLVREATIEAKELPNHIDQLIES